MKRLNMPRIWRLSRKTVKYALDPVSGPHKKDQCMPLGMILRDVLMSARTLFEAKKILNKGYVKVDGCIRKDYRFPVGVMDVLTIGEENYRILPSVKGFNIVKIDVKESMIKLCEIINKRCIKKKIQLNLYDGRNFLVEKDEYRTGDVLIIDLAKNQIADVLKFTKGSIAMVIGGNKSGAIGKIEDLIVKRSCHENEVIMIINGTKISIPEKYVFVVGADKPMISLGESSA